MKVIQLLLTHLYSSQDPLTGRRQRYTGCNFSELRMFRAADKQKNTTNKLQAKLSSIVLPQQSKPSMRSQPDGKISCYDIAIGTGGLRLESRNEAQCRQRLATAATFLRSCVVQALLAAEVGPAIRYTLQRNTSSIMKI